MQLRKLLACGLAGLGGLGGVCGCGCESVECGACAPSGIYIEVRDTGVDVPVEDATVIAGGRMCQLSGFSGPGWYLCDVEPGTYSIEVIAPWHQSQTVSVTLSALEDPGTCCGCGPQASAKVLLDPV